MIDPRTRGSDPETPHLFPSRVFGAHALSVQADRDGYACHPRIRSNDIAAYDRVEVTLWGPNGRMNPRGMRGIPANLVQMFDSDGTGRNLTHADVEALEADLRLAQGRGLALAEVDPEAVGVPLSNDELAGLLAGIDGALFAGQWARTDAAVDAVEKLLHAARMRGMELDEYAELAGIGDAPPKP